MRLREVIIDWLTASRYVRWLEARHIEQRMDFTERLGDKDAQIRQLRMDIAALKMECDRMRAESTTSVRAGYPAQSWAQATTQTPIKPLFQGFMGAGMDDWQAELNKLYEKENDGIPGEGRESVHEPTADDGA